MFQKFTERITTMKVTYLGHSGFLAETENACYLFDYIRGTLPKWEKEKPLYVFVSHSHADHFSMKIFEEEIAGQAAAYILSYDLRKKMERSRADLLHKNNMCILFAEPNKEISLPNCSVMPIKSTDIGVAFVVREGETCLYHAGDLNWWHWEGETKAKNRNMEVNYKREIERMKEFLNGRHLTVAFVPLDPRLENAYWYGMKFFMQTVGANHVFPMHFWEDYDVIDRYIAEHGSGQNIVKLKVEGQVEELPF
jgi:L-ascorbate metabolism protein UlaG (beta-lactamase superfamily)